MTATNTQARIKAGDIHAEGGQLLYRAPAGFRNLPKARQAVAVQRAGLAYRLSAGKRNLDGGVPSGKLSAHSVLYGVCAIAGIPSTHPEISLGRVSSFRLQYDRQAFATLEILPASKRAAWLTVGDDEFREVGIPRFHVAGSFLRFELPCLGKDARTLAGHVRSGGRLTAEAVIDELAERYEGRTKIITQAAVRGVVLRVGSERRQWVLTDDIRVR